MSLKEFVCSMLITSIIFGMCLPSGVLAVDATVKPVMSDVALSDGGVLEGKILDYQNTAQPGVPVTLKYQDRDVANTVTTAEGRFVVQDLRGGVYRVSTNQGDGIFRLWAPRTAPPVAQKQAIVYVQNQGAGGGMGLRGILGNPIIIPAVIATAIAVPIAVSSSHHAASP